MPLRATAALSDQQIAEYKLHEQTYDEGQRGNVYALAIRFGISVNTIKGYHARQSWPGRGWGPFEPELRKYRASGTPQPTWLFREAETAIRLPEVIAEEFQAHDVWYVTVDGVASALNVTRRTLERMELKCDYNHGKGVPFSGVMHPQLHKEVKACTKAVFVELKMKIDKVANTGRFTGADKRGWWSPGKLRRECKIGRRMFSVTTVMTRWRQAKERPHVYLTDAPILGDGRENFGACLGRGRCLRFYAPMAAAAPAALVAVVIAHEFAHAWAYATGGPNGEDKTDAQVARWGFPMRRLRRFLGELED
jgi:hypothetical protein